MIYFFIQLVGITGQLLDQFRVFLEQLVFLVPRSQLLVLSDQGFIQGLDFLGELFDLILELLRKFDLLTNYGILELEFFRQFADVLGRIGFELFLLLLEHLDLVFQRLIQTSKKQKYVTSLIVRLNDFLQLVKLSSFLSSSFF